MGSDPLAARPSRADQEGRQGLRAAVDELEQAVAASGGSVDDQWYGPLVAGLERLYEVFGYHVEVTDGVFPVLVTRAPWLAPRVAGPRADHLAIRAAIRDLLGELQTKGWSGGAGVADARQDVLRVLALVARHRLAEDLFSPVSSISEGRG